jgi:glycosyltransferase involved in cell wall biosynthesis
VKKRRFRYRWLRNVSCTTHFADQSVLANLMNSPTVSVVIPCFNQGHFLTEALESVFSQTRLPDEVVVVDDGSTDETPTVARKFPTVRCIRQSNRGLASARNTGLRHTRCDYLVFLDADDRLWRTAIEIGVRELNEHRRCAMVWGHCVRIDAHGRRLPTIPPPPMVGDAYEALLRNNFIWTPAVAMFRRSICAPLMRFNPAVDASADYELYLRIARAFPIWGHSATVADYRLHSASMSRNAALMLTSTMEVLRAQRPYVAKRRAYWRAYQQGRRSWQAYYGEQLIEQILQRAGDPRRWIQVGADVAVLARHYPRGLAARLAGTVLHRVERPRGRSTRVAAARPGEPPSSSDTDQSACRGPSAVWGEARSKEPRERQASAV